MGKSNHFSGQPLYSQVINLLNKSKILRFSRENGGERYTKRFNCWIHLVVMLYAVIMRFDSLSEITASLLAETHKLAHLGIAFKIELPAEILLRRERKCHQDIDMGEADSKSAADVDAERAETAVELLGTGDYGQDNADVLCRLLQPVQQPRKGLGNHSRQGIRCPARALAFRLRGAWKSKKQTRPPSNR